jgi:hypothetical protein
MGTKSGALSQILFGQGRRAILTLLYGHADEQFYLREIARRAGTGIGATQRELRQLSEAGLIHGIRRGHQIYYQANRKNPIFAELKSILAKTSGIRDTAAGNGYSSSGGACGHGHVYTVYPAVYDVYIFNLGRPTRKCNHMVAFCGVLS